MDKVYKTLLFLFITLFLTINTDAVSCRAGQAGCMASCSVQNCASGMCYPQTAPRSQQICKCVRCIDGPRY
jgi:hypothetical protein